jgi:hypothetical protein
MAKKETRFNVGPFIPETTEEPDDTGFVSTRPFRLHLDGEWSTSEQPIERSFPMRMTIDEKERLLVHTTRQLTKLQAKRRVWVQKRADLDRVWGQKFADLDEEIRNVQRAIRDMVPDERGQDEALPFPTAAGER